MRDAAGAAGRTMVLATLLGPSATLAGTAACTIPALLMRLAGGAFCAVDRLPPGVHDRLDSTLFEQLLELPLSHLSDPRRREIGVRFALDALLDQDVLDGLERAK